MATELKDVLRVNETDATITGGGIKVRMFALATDTKKIIARDTGGYKKFASEGITTYSDGLGVGYTSTPTLTEKFEVNGNGIFHTSSGDITLDNSGILGTFGATSFQHNPTVMRIDDGTNSIVASGSSNSIVGDFGTNTGFTIDPSKLRIDNPSFSGSYSQLTNTALEIDLGTSNDSASFSYNGLSMVDDSVGTITLNQTSGLTLSAISSPAYAEGRIVYNDDSKSFTAYNDISDVALNIGEEVWSRAKNNTGATILNGKVVYINGADTSKPTIDLADATEYDKSRVLGVATQDIGTGSEGYVTNYGVINDVDTSSFSAGDLVYLDPDTLGGLTSTRPMDGNFPILIGIVIEANALTGKIQLNINKAEYTAETVQITGWPEGIDAFDLAFTDGTRTLTVSPDSGTSATDFRWYEQGIKYTKTTDSIVLPDTEASFLVYYDEGTLTYVQDPSADDVSELIRTKPFVAIVYWNATDSKHELLLTEPHGISMSNDSHLYNHFTRGAQYLFGLGVNNIDTGGTGSTDTDAQFGMDSGGITDEDVPHFSIPFTSTSGLPIYYITGAEANPSLRSATETGFSVLTDTTAGTGSTGRIVYNELSGGTWGLTTVGSGDFALCHVFSNNAYDRSEGTFAIMGQGDYATLGQAQDGAEDEINGIVSLGLAGPEQVAIATIIFQTRDSYSNSVKSRTRPTESGDDYVDWRRTAVGGAGSSGGTTGAEHSDADFKVYNDSDTSKIITFDASSLSTATTRSYIWPDKDGTVAMLSDTGGGSSLWYEVGTGNLFSNNSGNLTLSGTYNFGAGVNVLDALTTGYHNIGNGYNVLTANTSGLGNIGNGAFVLENNINGNYNVGNGYQSLNANTSGSSNIGNGFHSLYLNTIGSSNVGNGAFSLNDNLSGSYNLGNGSYAGEHNSTGSYNVFEGYKSGSDYTGSNALTTVNQSVYIGAFTKALENSITNETVIGYNTTGHGSNTVTIGNTSVLGNYFNGNIYSNRSTAVDVFAQFTNSATGSGASDGTTFGIDSTGNAVINNYEAKDIIFKTTNATRMTLDDAGSLGLGITGPVRKFHIHDDLIPCVKLTNTSTGSAVTNGGELRYFSSELQLINFEAEPIAFFTTGVERMKIASDGEISMPAVYSDTLGATNKPLGIDSTGKLAPYTGESWTNATLGSDYTQTSGAATVGYYIDGDRVYLRGSADKGSSGDSTMFTLPVGYRPTNTVTFPFVDAVSGGSVWRITITSAGVVSIASASFVSKTLIVDSLNFRVSQ